MPERRTVDILIVTALDEELDSLLSFFPQTKTIHSQKCELNYHVGTLTCKDGSQLTYAITRLYRMGNTDAGVAVVNAIRDFSPTNVIMFGLAAGVEGRTNIGSVIVSSNIFYYEHAKLHPDTVETRPQSYQADVLLASRIRDFAATYSAGHEVNFGPFAVGEKVVAASQAVDELKKSEPKLIGIEMESYGVAKAAASAQHRPRFIAVRGVSDYADENKNDDFRQEALDNAAQFLLAFLKEGTLPRESPSTATFDTATPLIAIHHISLDYRPPLELSLKRDFSEYYDIEVNELLVNQTDVYRDGCLTNPVEALDRQTDLIERLNDFINLYPQAQIGYFGLAHVPLIFKAGYDVNRRVVDVFATNRSSGQWLRLINGDAGPTLEMKEWPTETSIESGDVIVKVSISYQVLSEQIKGIVKDPLSIFHLGLDDPKPDTVTTIEQLETYTRAFHGLLAEINKRFPNTKRIHLFLAAPPTVVFRFGQQVSRTIDPDIIAYNFSRKDSPCYGWAINIATGEVIDSRTKKEHIND